jgi:hypothetical protein
VIQVSEMIVDYAKDLEIDIMPGIGKLLRV